jgi:RNA polymerase sigma-70 factor (ECF subfamily)
VIRPRAWPRDHSGRTDPELLRGVAEGDVVCLGELYDRHAHAVWRAVRLTLSGSNDVEDVVHATFLNLPRIASSYDGGAECAGWLCGIAVRLSLKHRRGVRRFRRVLDSFSHALTARSPREPERSASEQERGPLFEQALAGLSAEKRAVFVLVELEGLTSDEVSKALEVPASAVRTRLLHAQRDLHAALHRGAKP